MASLDFEKLRPTSLDHFLENHENQQWSATSFVA